MTSLRGRVLAAGITAAVMAATAGSALGATTDPVVTAIKGQDQAIKASSKTSGLEKIKTVAEAKAAEPKIAALARKLDHAAQVVSQAKATTSAEKRGRSEWVSGVRDVARGFIQFDGALKALAAGQKPAAKAADLKAVKTIASGGKLILKADKSLGIS